MNQTKNEQRSVCVWLDNQPDRSKDSLDTENDLRTIVNSFQYYNDLNRCLDFLINIENVKIIFITVDILAENIIPIIHSSEQIHSIYILHSMQKQWAKDYKKIKGFYNNRKLMCQKIEENLIRPKNKSNTGISFISSIDIHSNDLNRQDPSFMYFQLIKEILLNDHLNEIEEETKRDMLNYCRRIYIDRRSSDTLDILDEFEQNFIPELSVYWYTRECFLYKILNTALRTPQPDVLYKLRYFLRHLHQQILSQSKSQRRDQTSIIVYRGQSMSEEQIEKLKENVGGFLSFNNFLSTSLRRDVAFNFVWGSETGVLFEMFIDTTIEKFPFASIEHLSFQQGQRGESEILFSAGTVFRIVEIDKRTDYYHVQLILSNDIDEQLAEYTKRTREQTHSPHSFLSLLKLMHELSQYTSVERFAEMLDDGTSLATNSAILGPIHHAFGLIYLSRGQSKEALNSFRQSLSIHLTVLPADHPKLSPTYNNIGSVHLAQSDYETALTFHQLALNCETNSENPDLSAIVVYTNNIASIYNQEKKYNDALIYHKRALELQEHLGENDLSLTNTYNAISAIYYKLDDYEQAS
jgi:tetratricopeptide (TPR) repeat protein